ncbi:TetR/AcrR family transcriptional regulator [Rhodococcus sp. P1Y]|uniref:TetR/AcrR family transcriptional regulator n=1 Tax=Rhodococcus sp. P1Y TaxID=1302308 RepID=UPI000EAC16D3|nr:TetR/AcrR family transcriptional regulator [Rhodococcus sp. P1Y]AYJ47895.1 TetR/AcrR family transcriptional regulator [Rhodococcus sp. P1Y]
MTTDSETSGRAYGGESAEDRDERRRRQLLDAGLRVFGSVGYRAATVRGLCREAKVADRHFYQYFDRTEDLLLAVYGECIAHLTESISHALAGLGDGSDIGTVVGRGLDALFECVEDPHLARVVWIEVLGVSPSVERTYLSAMKNFGSLMLEYLRAFETDLASGRDVDLDLLAAAAVGGISHTAMAWFASEYAAERRIVVATTTAFLSSIVVPLTAHSQRR